jgi:hypothetical protein
LISGVASTPSATTNVRAPRGWTQCRLVRHELLVNCRAIAIVVSRGDHGGNCHKLRRDEDAASPPRAIVGGCWATVSFPTPQPPYRLRGRRSLVHVMVHPCIREESRADQALVSTVQYCSPQDLPMAGLRTWSSELGFGSKERDPWSAGLTCFADMGCAERDVQSALNCGASGLAVWLTRMRSTCSREGWPARGAPKGCALLRPGTGCRVGGWECLSSRGRNADVHTPGSSVWSLGMGVDAVDPTAMLPPLAWHAHWKQPRRRRSPV